MVGMSANLNEISHRRFNPLTGEWLLVSPHRTQRPWLGQTEPSAAENLPAYDPQCYLCPGNVRAGGERNPNYSATFVFANDFAALTPELPVISRDNSGKGLIVAQSESGICRVLCFSPRHDLTISRMGLAEVRTVVDAWRDEYLSLGALPAINYVQIFENRGAMMGCSNPHPHCQIWADATLPNEIEKEQAHLSEYQQRENSCLLCDYLELERGAAERIVCENECFLVVVPFWAVWPYETLVLAKRHLGSLAEFGESERADLADILRCLTIRYDNLFQTSFPYSMGFHQSPTDGASHPEWHFHAHFYPPLLRSATVRKFLVGYEMLAQPQRDITAEAAAARLRSLPEQHYTRQT